MGAATANPPAKRPAQQQKPAVPSWDKPTNKKGLEELINPAVVLSFNKGLPSVVAGQGERLIRAMISECQANPALMDCTPVSLFSCTMRAGLLGLTIGGPTGEAYLIPFNNKRKGVKEAQLIIGYKGYIKLAYRSKEIKRITPVVVREGDTFDYCRGYDQNILHVPARGKANRRPTDYYVVVELVNGGKDFETFTFDDAIDFRERYCTTRNAPDYVKSSSPWYDMVGGGFDAQAMKTLIRLIAKRLPLSVDLAEASTVEEAVEREIGQALVFNPMPEALPAAAPAESLADDIEAAELRERLDAEGEAVPAGNGRLFGDSGQLPD